MRSFRLAAVGLALGLAGATTGTARPNPTTAPWPPITREQRPWAYWWWMGSAVDKANLSRELTRYRDAGYGGVHIIPIYGAKGWEARYVQYLSPQWMELLDHTVREARRLDLGVDMTTGTGWCFGGGPDVTEREGNAEVVVKTHPVAAGHKLEGSFARGVVQALMAFPVVASASAGLPGPAAVDLLERIQPDGSVDWTAPGGAWMVYELSQRFQGQKVKRAGPGGEGPMLNLLYPAAIKVYLRQFTQAFSRYHGLKPRAQYHDSYEYKSDWAPDFLAQFEKRRGYRLENEFPALFGSGSDHSARVLYDYRATVSDLLTEESMPQWVKWSHDHGFLTRNEAHGAPGNLLDLYALADMPETEMFRLDRNRLVSKFASSAAHLAGRKLTTAETGTWLKEHFTETLADMKYLVDDMFLSGVNHVFYHGTCYSPDEAGWPGWLFYASYEMNPRNPIWRDARTLNDYVARCQAVLQAGQPDNDVLLYWPLPDYWQKAPAPPRLPHLTIHAREWFEGQPVGAVAERLWQRGFAFDYASDRQLQDMKITRGSTGAPSGNYRVLVVPECEVIPLESFQRILQLARVGCTIIFQNRLPQDVPGWGDLAARRAKFRKLLGAIAPAGETRLGRGRIMVGELESALNWVQVSRETLVDQAGLFCIRRRAKDGCYYFIANRGEVGIDGWIPLATPFQSSVLMDPMTGRTGRAAQRQGPNQAEVYLQLRPGESLIVQTLNQKVNAAPAWNYYRATGGAASGLTGPWQVAFLSRGPALPAPFELANTDAGGLLGSWSRQGGAAENFAGTARYVTRFNLAEVPKLARLGLGRIEQSARVKLNGQDFGTLIEPPFELVVDNLKSTNNQLEVEVTSTAANAIRYYDRAGIVWKNFHDINFVNQDYRPFNAANWPVADCGLIGPVSLSPMESFSPTGLTP